MRVFPNGLGFSILLASSLTLAWFSKDSANVFGQWGGGIFNHAAIILIFFLQGYKMKRTELFKIWHQPGHTIRVQVGIFLGPALIVLCAWFFDLLTPQWLPPFILLACLPTTIASSVVFSEKAGGDPGFTLGQATLSNLLGPVIVFFCVGLFAGRPYRFIWYPNRRPYRTLPAQNYLFYRNSHYDRVVDCAETSLLRQQIVGEMDYWKCTANLYSMACLSCHGPSPFSSGRSDLPAIIWRITSAP